MRFYFNKAEMVIFFCGIFVDSFVQCVYFTRYIKVDQLVLCEAGEKVAFTSCRDGERGRKGGGGCTSYNKEFLFKANSFDSLP